jgi:four helix bundle protein
VNYASGEIEKKWNIVLKMTTYKNLDAWKTSMELVKEIFVATKTFPREEIYGLASQIKRAAVSVPANIAEGIGRNYRKDSIQFLHISRGSLYELETLLNISYKIDILAKPILERLSEILDRCIMMINGLIKYFETADLK